MKQDRSRPAQDSSVLFSLNELMSLEKERLAEEEAERSAQLEAARVARMDAEARAAQAQEAARQAELSRIAAEAANVRAEAARREAMQMAIVESARIAAMQHAKLAEMEVQQTHERALASVRARGVQTRLRVAAVGLSLLVLGVTLGGVSLWMRSRETLRQTEAAHREEVERSIAKQAQIERDLAAAEAEAHRVAQELEHARATGVVPTTTPHLGPTHRPFTAAAPSSVHPKVKCQCREGDPTCREMPNGTCTFGF